MPRKVVFAFPASLCTSLVLAGAHDCPVWKGFPDAEISIPAQPLNQALQALAAQTGLDILFEPSTVAGLRGVAVRGKMNPGDALCQLLDDLALVYTLNADRTVIITRKSQRDSAAPPASGPSDGLRSGTSRSPPADVIDSSETAQVVVTGTRRNDRRIADSPVPISVIGGETLSEMGHGDTARALSALVPDFDFPQPSLTDGTDIIRPATLHGLGSDQMLVLVNGKRRHVSALLNINSSVGRGTAAVDMSLLPASAVDHVEILNDGAAAQYGSDAIAGVVNVLLKKQHTGADVSITYGQNDTTIEGVRSASGLQTRPDGQPVVQPDAVYGLKYGANRTAHDGETVILAGNAGLPLGSDGFLDLAAQARDLEPTNRAGEDPRRQYTLTPVGSADPREFTFDRLSQHFGEPRIKDADAVLNAGLPIAGGAAEWYAFGTYGVRNGRTEGFYRMPDDPRTVTAIFPDGFLAQLEVDLEDQALTSGLRGTWNRWTYDASVNYGRNVIDFVTANSNNASLGSASPTRFDAGGLRYEQSMVNLDLRRDVESGWFERPVSVALGLEYRTERFAIRAGDPASYEQGPVVLPNGQAAAAGAQVFPGFRPDNVTDRGRHSASAYVDLEQDVRRGWTVALAGRAERYSDFGSSLNYKVATRVGLGAGLSVRAGAATGFRAPSLHQQFFSTTSTNNVGGRFVDIGTFAVTDGVARALGARDLRPELSHSFSAGLVYDRPSGLHVALDCFQIAVKDRIVLTENLGASGTPEQNAAVQAVLSRAGYNSISGARFFINGIDTLTRGIDLLSSYSLADGYVGHLQLTAGYTYTTTDITRHIDDLDPLAQIPGLVLFGRVQSELIERGQPRSRLNLTADWRRGRLSATVRTNRYGDVLAAGIDPRDDLVVRPAWVTDLELRFAPGPVQLSVGAENVFDKYPTAEPTGTRPAALGGNYALNNYILPFSVLSPFGFSGRYLYGRVGYRF